MERREIFGKKGENKWNMREKLWKKRENYQRTLLKICRRVILKKDKYPKKALENLLVCAPAFYLKKIAAALHAPGKKNDF